MEHLLSQEDTVTVLASLVAAATQAEASVNLEASAVLEDRVVPVVVSVNSEVLSVDLAALVVPAV